MGERRWRRRAGLAGVAGAVVAVVGIGGAATTAVTALPACIGKQCDGVLLEYGRGSPSEGDLIDENRWESTPMSGRWVDFGPSNTVIFHVDELAPRQIMHVTPLISPDPEPNHLGSNFSLAAGSLAEVTIVGDDVWVANSTCAPYYIRLEVEAYPLVDAGPPDAGDGGVSDGGPGDGAVADAGAIDGSDGGD